MQSDNLGDREEPPSCSSFKELKEFPLRGQRFLERCSGQRLERLALAAQAPDHQCRAASSAYATLTREEFAGATLANHKLALAITPYFFNLIDAADENCPIRWQVIPRIEGNTHPLRGKCPILAARTPIRRCRAWCIAIPTPCSFSLQIAARPIAVFARDTRLVSNATGYDFHPQFDQQIDYIRRNPAIRDVLLSVRRPAAVQR